MHRKSPNQTDSIEEKAFVYSRQSREAIEIGVLIPQAIFEKLNSEQIERIVSSFILELAGITLSDEQDFANPEQVN
jgi:glutamate dehydrogenase/leucine dehydrogenase